MVSATATCVILSRAEGACGVILSRAAGACRRTLAFAIPLRPLRAARRNDGLKKLRHFRACQEHSFKTWFAPKCGVALDFPRMKNQAVVLDEIVGLPRRARPFDTCASRTAQDDKT